MKQNPVGLFFSCRRNGPLAFLKPTKPIPVSLLKNIGFSFRNGDFFCLFGPFLLLFRFFLPV